MSDNFIRTYEKVLTRDIYDSVLAHTDGTSVYEVDRTVNRKKDFIDAVSYTHLRAHETN